jgi:hypothetical protein
VTIPDPSFLPYLDEGTSRFFLRISPASQDSAVLQKVAYPFFIMSDSNPLGRLIAAQMVTDAEHNLRDLFLLAQKDRYTFAKDSLRPITNRDVEQMWQDTFAFYSKQHRNGNLVILRDQLDKSGRLLPFQPVFYCKFRFRFFHPLCPSCGNQLSQCYDDAILSRVGLGLYSNSLKRYLYCENCWLDGSTSRFFVYEYDVSDSNNVTDFAGLIKGFGPLARERLDLTEFPCPHCSHKNDCYGAENLVTSRLIPFSFHSFHLLVFEAMSLSAADFLALLGGSSFSVLEEQLVKNHEIGRLRCLRAINQSDSIRLPFVFEGHDTYFLEVFYLKLSFLVEIARIVLSESAEFGPDTVGLLMDAIWVRVHDDVMRLPYTWNFKVDLIDTVRLPDETSGQPPSLPIRNRYFLGLVWLYALLVNSRQDLAAMYQNVRRVMQKPELLGEWLRGEAEAEALRHALAPENVFWDPSERLIPEQWQLLWKKALAMGFSFLGDRFFPDRKWTREEWMRELQALLAEVKGQMLHGAAVKDGAVQATPTKIDMEGITHILERIREKWASAAEGEPVSGVPQTGAMVAAPGESAETAPSMVASETPRSEGVAIAAQGVPFIEDAITETIIISPVRPSQEAVKVTTESAGPAEGLKGEAGLTGLGRIGAETGASDALAETVFLGGQPREVDQSASSAGELVTQPEESSQPAVSEEDLLPVTVMLAPGQTPPAKVDKPELTPEIQEPPTKSEEEANEEDLLATVQITPSQPKPKEIKRP